MGCSVLVLLTLRRLSVMCSYLNCQAQCKPLHLQEEHALASGVHITADAASADLGGNPVSADCIAPAVQAVCDLTRTVGKCCKIIIIPSSCVRRCILPTSLLCKMQCYQCCIAEDTGQMAWAMHTKRSVLLQSLLWCMVLGLQATVDTAFAGDCYLCTLLSTRQQAGITHTVRASFSALLQGPWTNATACRAVGAGHSQ